MSAEFSAAPPRARWYHQVAWCWINSRIGSVPPASSVCWAR
jgi:hypothetical protein